MNNMIPTPFDVEMSIIEGTGNAEEADALIKTLGLDKVLYSYRGRKLKLSSHAKRVWNSYGLLRPRMLDLGWRLKALREKEHNFSSWEYYYTIEAVKPKRGLLLRIDRAWKAFWD